MFVNFDSNAASFGSMLVCYELYLVYYDLFDIVCFGTFMFYDLLWNWKVMFENFNDGYYVNWLY